MQACWCAQDRKSAPGADDSRGVCRRPGCVRSSRSFLEFPAPTTGRTPATTATGCPTTATTAADGACPSRLQWLQILSGSPKAAIQERSAASIAAAGSGCATWDCARSADECWQK